MRVSLLTAGWLGIALLTWVRQAPAQSIPPTDVPAQPATAPATAPASPQRALVSASPSATSPQSAPNTANADAPAAPGTDAPSPTPSATPTQQAGPSTPDAESGPVLCQETFPKDQPRPKIEETFPVRGTAGHVAWLELTITHQAGEQVLPGGISFPPDAEERSLLRGAQFELPLPESDVKPSVTPPGEGGPRQTRVRIPLIPLPDTAGRATLTLPGLPISVARASGQVHTLCTSTHALLVEDPLASTPNPAPAADPEARQQREIWWAARDAALVALIALPLALLLAYLFFRFKDRFKKVAPPPPPRPPWEIAMAQLDRLEAEGLLDRHEYELFLDRASDSLREYLGRRYGFEGLESTTREILRQLEGRAPDFEFTGQVRTLLQRTDLVKFARRLPDHEECRDALAEVRSIVRGTTPSTQQKSTPDASTQEGAA